MKYFAFLILFLSTSVQADIRDICENAHYATDYVKLHEYRVLVDWSKISDSNLVKLENVIYGKYFLVTKEYELENYKTIFLIKENTGFDPIEYSDALNRLQKATVNGVSCLYRTSR